MNHWIAYWFTFFTPHIPTPNYWQMWGDEQMQKHPLAGIPGI